MITTGTGPRPADLADLPATELAPDGQPYAAVGLQVTADQLTAVAVDAAGGQLLCWRRAFPGTLTGPARAVTAVAALAGRVAARVTDEGHHLLGLTVGVPGLVDGAGCVRRSQQLGWRDLNLAADLRTALGRPGYGISVDNDANLAVTAEHRYGGHGAPDLAYLDGGIGVGAGVMLGGHLLRGGLGFAGEIGHIQLDPAGPACPCGHRGCLEVMASPAAVVRAAIPDVELDGPIIDLAPEVDRVVSLARGADPVTLAALAEAGRHLGHGVSILTNLLNPQVVALGGYFGSLARWLLPAAQDELLSRNVAADAGGCRLVVSRLTDTAAALGAAARALQAVDGGRFPPRPGAG